MAADATGTPTVPDSIPTYNPTADAPSGNGFNAAMAAIQVALSARVSKPVGILTGEVPVWNGASWDRSTTTRVGATSLGTGTPDATKFLRGDGAWASAGALYKKTTSKTVNTTVAETDLLNSEITVAANAIGASGVLKLTAFGDWKQNCGVGADLPRFKVKLGATTLLDTGVTGGAASRDTATRYSWKLVADIANLGATNSQWSNLLLVLSYGGNLAQNAAFTTGTGSYVAMTTQTNTMAFAEGGNATAVDTTSAQALVLSVINASNNANYEVVLKNALVEIA